MGMHSAIDTFGDITDPTNGYRGMLGAGYVGHNELQAGQLIAVDDKFPGMEKVLPGYAPFDQWYALKDFRADLHVVLALDCAKMKGKLYRRPNYPIAWARREGKGRVFYTGIGHTATIWKDPIFRQMILGGVRWVCGQVDADVSPNLQQVTPRANDIPETARRVNSSDPGQLKRD
jgi:type 1 glutamine amidotransferase